MDVGLSLLPCLTSPPRGSCVLDPQHKQPAAKSNFFLSALKTLHVSLLYFLAPN